MKLKYLLISAFIIVGGIINAQEIKPKKVNETELDEKKISNDDTVSQEELEKLKKENEKLKKELENISENEVLIDQDTTKVNKLSEEIENGKYEDDDDFYGIHFKDNEDHFTIIIRDKSKLKKYKYHKPRTRFRFDMDFGWDGLISSKDPQEVGVEYPDFDMWPSMYYGFSFNTKTRLFKENSPVHIKYGLGFQWTTFRVKGDYILQKINGRPEYTLDPVGRSLDKSRVRNWHMTLPVMLQFDFSKRNMDTGFKFGVGAYGGVRLYTWQTVKYKDADGDKVKNKTRNQFYMNPFNYGLQAEIGYGSFSVLAKYDMSPLFNVDNPYDYNAWNLGAKFSF
ncbi:MAG: outer membrane beta-barrel protein [Flavobacteriales bacterium]|nr:outer membrane beta-barrel protein [Flavobacteriales bacterium]